MLNVLHVTRIRLYLFDLQVLIVNKQRSMKNTSVHDLKFSERDTEEVQIHDFNCN